MDSQLQSDHLGEETAVFFIQKKEIFVRSMSLQVADLFDAHAAKAPIHRLVSVLNAQAAQILELQASLQRLQVSQQQTAADCHDLHASVAPLDGRIGALEDDSAWLKKFRREAQARLETIDRNLNAKASKQEVHVMESEMSKSVQQLAKALRDDLASVELVQCLHTEQSALHDRMETVDRQLAAKMDKSEATRMDGVLAQINSFRPVVAEVTALVSSVQERQQEFELSLVRLDSEREAHRDELHELRDHLDDLQGIVNGAEERHHRAVAPQIIRLDGSVMQLQDALDNVNTTVTTNEVTARKVSAKLSSSVGVLATQLQQQHRHFENALTEKASQLEIKAELVDVNRQLAAKASSSDHKALSSRVETLLIQCEKLQHHVEVSTRFVDWFARRGEAYEHNLDLVETQLGRLALASHPRDREPFGDRVRYPRSP